MAQGSLKTAAVIALALASACASPSAKAPPAAPTIAPPAPVATPPPAAPTAAVAPAPTPQPDSCGALPLQYLVGRPRTEIPVPVNPGNRRVVCSSCFVSQDYKPYRQTITYDPQTGLVTSVKCG